MAETAGNKSKGSPLLVRRIEMSIPRIEVFITMSGDPSVGIQPITDTIRLIWDLDEEQGERERVRTILSKAWGEL